MSRPFPLVTTIFPRIRDVTRASSSMRGDFFIYASQSSLASGILLR